MSVMSELDQDLQTIRAIIGPDSAALTYEPTTEAELAEDQLARELNAMIDRLDEFVKMVMNPETSDLIEKEAFAFGQVYTRAALIANRLTDIRRSSIRLVK